MNILAPSPTPEKRILVPPSLDSGDRMMRYWEVLSLILRKPLATCPDAAEHTHHPREGNPAFANRPLTKVGQQ